MTGLFLLHTFWGSRFLPRTLFFGTGRTRYQLHFGKLSQHLVGKFYAALGLVKGKVAGNGISDEVGGADFVFGVLHYKTYESNRTVLHGIQRLLRGGFGFLFGRVVLRFGQIFSSRVFGSRRLGYERVGVKVKKKRWPRSLMEAGRNRVTQSRTISIYTPTDQKRVGFQESTKLIRKPTVNNLEGRTRRSWSK